MQVAPDFIINKIILEKLLYKQLHFKKIQNYNKCYEIFTCVRQVIESFGVVTSCTSRKRAVGDVARLKASELRGDPEKVAARWRDVIKNALPMLPAGDLYLGRAMSESKAVALRLAGSLHVVSAGLGFVEKDVLIPSYDLTVTHGVGSLGTALREAGVGPSDWWRELNALKGLSLPLSSHINQAVHTKFLIAMPAVYFCMLEHELAGLDESALKRVYIFTSRIGVGMLAPRMQKCAMPYDERLEGHKQFSGTRSDFPQRAMRHFVEKLNGQQLNVERANSAVKCAMEQLKKPILPLRARRGDEEIVELIRSQWMAHGGNSSRLLRYLRDVALVACEQSRFRDLWRRVKADSQ